MKHLLFVLLLTSLTCCSTHSTGEKPSIERNDNLSIDCKLVEQSVQFDQEFELVFHANLSALMNPKKEVNLSPSYAIIDSDSAQDTLSKGSFTNFNVSADQPIFLHELNIRVPVATIQKQESRYKIVVNYENTESKHIYHCESSDFHLFVPAHLYKGNQRSTRPYASMEGFSAEATEYGISAKFTAFVNPTVAQLAKKLAPSSVDFSIQTFVDTKAVSSYFEHAVFVSEGSEEIHFFIPYTAINLKEGKQDITLIVQATNRDYPRKSLHKEQLEIEQPTIYTLTYTLNNVSIDASDQDMSSVIGRAFSRKAGRGTGDVYYQFSQLDIPLKRSKVVRQSGEIGKSSGSFSIFPHQPLTLSFRDQDLIGSDEIQRYTIDSANLGTFYVKIAENKITNCELSYTISVR